MSFLSELSLLLDQHKDQFPLEDLKGEEKKKIFQCINAIHRIIKKRPKNKPEKKPREPSDMQIKKLAEKSFVTQTPMTLTAGDRKWCYVCKGSMKNEAHSFYDAMCVECGNYNFYMRNKQKDLTGMTAIVTGGRIKIGYEVALWLLKNNCYVIVTTRFPADALARFKKEPNYEAFKDRLFLYGLDFRDLKKVYQFVDYVQTNFKEINILINNAAQTLFQTDAYNKQLLQDEEMALKALQEDPENKINSDLSLMKTNIDSVDTQLGVLEKNFPVYDINHMPVDFSSKNSWLKEADEVGFREFAEAQLINSWVPFILCANLKKLMIIPDKKSFIINVSAMEGKFDYKHKKSTHPHNNMAKAAMNMMTRTCGSYYANNGIYMTSVDTGWCSEMRPNQMFASNRTVPLDEIDGAMRILHPIIDDLDLHSVLLKDYKVVTW